MAKPCEGGRLYTTGLVGPGEEAGLREGAAAAEPEGGGAASDPLEDKAMAKIRTPMGLEAPPHGGAAPRARPAHAISRRSRERETWGPLPSPLEGRDEKRDF